MPVPVAKLIDITPGPNHPVQCFEPVVINYARYEGRLSPALRDSRNWSRQRQAVAPSNLLYFQWRFWAHMTPQQVWLYESIWPVSIVECSDKVKRMLVDVFKPEWMVIWEKLFRDGTPKSLTSEEMVRLGSARQLMRQIVSDFLALLEGSPAEAKTCHTVDWVNASVRQDKSVTTVDKPVETPHLDYTPEGVRALAKRRDPNYDDTAQYSVMNVHYVVPDGSMAQNTGSGICWALPQSYSTDREEMHQDLFKEIGGETVPISQHPGHVFVSTPAGYLVFFISASTMLKRAVFHQGTVRPGRVSIEWRELVKHSVPPVVLHQDYHNNVHKGYPLSRCDLI